MQRSRFGRIAAYLAIATVILNALGTTVWVLVVGYRLLRLARENVEDA